MKLEFKSTKYQKGFKKAQITTDCRLCKKLDFKKLKCNVAGHIFTDERALKSGHCGWYIKNSSAYQKL